MVSLFLSKRRNTSLTSLYIISGLVILDARYGPSERGEGAEGLDVDVTIPVRALVNSSQLYIPGRRSKVRCTCLRPLHSVERKSLAWLSRSSP